MRVYNLTTSQFGLSNVALRRVKIARFSDLNDPFELLAVDVAERDLRAGILAKKQLINEQEGLISFSRTWRDPILWSHYGEKHRGLCLGFDVPDSHLVVVKYVKGLHKIDVASKSTKQQTIDHLLNRLRFTKFDGWEYEKEVRRFIDIRTLNAQSGLYFLPFSPDLVLREVILGPRCDLPIESIRNLAEQFTPKLHVVRSRIAYTKFAVVEDRTGRVSKGNGVLNATSGIAALLT
jgi:hypothetical protein